MAKYENHRHALRRQQCRFSRRKRQQACKVVNVPAYSPGSWPNRTVALMLTLNRKIHKTYQRTRDANFSLEGLVGFNMFGKTVGVNNTGKIGVATIKVLLGLAVKSSPTIPLSIQRLLR